MGRFVRGVSKPRFPRVPQRAAIGLFCLGFFGVACSPPASAQQTPPADIARTVAAIASMGSASSPTFSPDGGRIAYVSNASGIPQVWIIPTAGGTPTQLTNLPDAVQSVYWSPTGDRLVFDVAPGGGLNVQIYVIRSDGTGMKLLTGGGADNNRLFGWTKDGKYVRAASNADFPTGFDAVLLDPDGGPRISVVHGNGLNTITDVSRDGGYAVISRTASRNDNNYFLVDLKSSTETLLTPHEGPAATWWGQFSPDGKRVYVVSNIGRDRPNYGVIELDEQGKPKPIRYFAERADAEGEDSILSPDGSKALLFWNASGRSEVAILDTRTGKLTPGPKLEPDHIDHSTFSKDGTKVAMAGFATDRPTDIYLYDLAAGGIEQLTHSSHEGVDLATLVEPELVSYKAEDGLDLSGWLYLPRNFQRPGPLVFQYHGGPESLARPTSLPGNEAIQGLVSRNIAVFQPNVRGSSGFGKRFVNLDNGALRKNAIRDIAATTRHLVEMGIADPKRLGIMGASHGGYMTMAGVTEYPDMFAAAADLYGIVNFETFFKGTQPWIAAISASEYGDPVKDADVLRDLSPIHKLDRIKTPLIVLHGANDTNVPVVEAEQVVANLRGRNVPVEYILFPDEGHGWVKLSNVVRATTAIVTFFDKKLN